jgi:cholesterol transport system auxiliary component
MIEKIGWIRCFVSVAVLSVLLSACVELPGSGDPSRLYVLTPKSTFPENLPTVDWQLLVEVPVSAAGLNTARIAARHSPIELNYIGAANWTDFVPRMVQSLLVESFENSGKIVGVGREAIGLRSDYLLKTEVREFQAEFDGTKIGSAKATIAQESPPEVRVRINAKLIKMPQRSIIASQTFENLVKSDENSMDSIIRTFDDALGKALKDIVVWSLTNGEARWSK